MPAHRKLLLIAVFIFIAIRQSTAADWPLSRSDANRSAASPAELPDDLHLLWVRQLPRLEPAWPDQPKMQFDEAYDPIVVGHRLFVGSPHDGSITAYATGTGEELWRFYTDGPVRFAPAAAQNKLYCASDDGYLYCLGVEDGTLLWRFRGGPADRRILGNQRLVSTWPARGAPVVKDGTVYFAAGIWPFMGIFLHALDAATGQVLWTNDGDGSIYIKQPHNSDSFAGVAPQGALVAIGDRLLIPGGRSVPACYDRTTGKLLYYQLAEHAKRAGGSNVAAVDELFFNGGAAFDVQSERYLGSIGQYITFGEGRLYDYSDRKLRTLDLSTSQVKVTSNVDRKGATAKLSNWSIDELSSVEVPVLTALIKAGSRLYAGGKHHLLAFALPLPRQGAAAIAWKATLPGTAVNLAAADDKLFATTREGQILCYGKPIAAGAAPQQFEIEAQPLPLDPAWSAQAAAILKTTGAAQGYCLVAGVGTGGLATELLRQSQLHLVIVEPDAQSANALRDRLRTAGIGGDRASVLVAELQAGLLPPYLASLAVSERLPAEADARAALVAALFASLRPYGGVACLPVPADQTQALTKSLQPYRLAGATWKPAGDLTLLLREGALPGSADWTHEHADAANTRVGKDTRVKAPLGLLWFGGPSNEAILPRHGHGPQPQVVDGRLFIEGMNMLRAMDIYTGRMLWEADLPGVGALYDNTAHQPGANASGTNYIATSGGIYVTLGNACVQLDPSNGRRIGEFQLPPAAGSDAAPLWGYLNVFEDYLIGGADPLFDPGLAKSRDSDNYSSSGRLIVMDRTSGKVLWTAGARSGFRHNAICLGGGRLYCIDRLSGAQLSRLKRRGEHPPHAPRLVVFDLKTGQELWTTEQDVFGTWLSYSVERDVLVQAGRAASDTMSDEPKGMRAYQGRDGSVLWENKSFVGPAMIHHDTILMAGRACHLLTGAPHLREHPLSGEQVEWTWSRNYGCNTPMASEHLLTFRSGAAGYFDFCSDGGTGNFGGFRSSCSNNLIVAGGVLAAPDYTRTCVCSYQNQTSLALVHMPEAEMWTSFGSQSPRQAVRRVGINLGAPGDRKADDDTLWLEYPSVGGLSPEVDVTIAPEQPEWFRRHSSQVTGPGLSWVAASGAKGLSSLKIKLGTADRQPRPYTIRLYFMEPDDVQPGERVFGVRIQAKSVLPALDIVQAAGGRNRTFVQEFSGIEVGEDLRIELTPHASAKIQAPVLSGVEVQADGW